jgi:NADH-quinone oxidoreductase subunit G
MPKLTIDDREIEVAPGTVIIQACEQLGIEIPRFCYHERLAIAGNCRMCLVEVSPGPPKPQASCALPCADGMVVKTNTPMVKKAREGVMEFLLINHPLDCPICDQAGECDLQDQSMYFGSGKSRYHEQKRSVEDKNMGPLINTFMNRCIHCTRCVRFITDVAGVPELGGLGRGEHMEIGTYVEKSISSELSGNIVDLCPVGALTSKPYTYMARPWELTKTESIDVMDAVGSNIRVDARGEAVMRILPRLHDDVNEEWISDKTRHVCDGLRSQRLDRPYIRDKHGKLQPASWQEAFKAIKTKMQSLAPENMAAIAGNLACTESMFALKQLMDSVGIVNLDCRQEGSKIATASRGDYLFNSGITGIDQADVMLLVGTNPRVEASLINARIRKRWLSGNLKIYLVGEEAELTYPYEYLGNQPELLPKIASGKHALSEILKAAAHPMIVVGTAAIGRKDGEAVYNACKSIAQNCNMVRDDWNGFNVLHHAAARVGALDVGFVPSAGGRDMAGIIDGCQSGIIQFVYLLGVDEIDMSLFGNACVIYQGHHGDIGAHRADVVLPGAAYTEKDATYVNTEGRVQRAKRAVFPVGDAKEDWTILRALSEALGKTLPYNTLSELRNLMAAKHPQLAKLDTIASFPISPAVQGQAISAKPFEALISNFYMTDPISRASKTMAECTRASKQISSDKEAA